MAYSNLDDFEYKNDAEDKYRIIQTEDVVYRFENTLDEIKEDHLMVNSPAHYTRGRVEAIEVIEDAIQDAPSVTEGMLQGQVLKYILRLWLKEKPLQDANKARWYLNRLISKLEETD